MKKITKQQNDHAYYRTKQDKLEIFYETMCQKQIDNTATP